MERKKILAGSLLAIGLATSSCSSGNGKGVSFVSGAQGPDVLTETRMKVSYCTDKNAISCRKAIEKIKVDLTKTPLNDCPQTSTDSLCSHSILEGRFDSPGKTPSSSVNPLYDLVLREAASRDCAPSKALVSIVLVKTDLKIVRKSDVSGIKFGGDAIIEEKHDTIDVNSFCQGFGRKE